MSLDPRTPVIVGVGQVTQRVDPAEALEPVDLMAEAARRAAADSSAGGLLDDLDSIRVVQSLTRRYPDPAALVAERLGSSPKQTAVTTLGGNSPQSLVNVTALAIGRGELDVALLTGAEAWRTRTALRRAGTKANWTTQPDDTPPPDRIGEDLTMSSPAETALGLVDPVQVYPMFENALRAHAGRSIEEHSTFISELWADFSRVASTNPYAWSQERRTAEEIRTVSPANRMIGFPYPKLMNSNNDVDQSAALLVCSVEAARSAGVPEDRWVFPHAGTDAHDHPFVSNRETLRSSPAIRFAGRRALDLAGVTADELTHVDLYSCFPSAVQIAATELGLGLDRPLTVTGGLCFAGGPWNNYVMHAIATMVALLREEPEAVGFNSANGGFTTKHAFGVYAARPPAVPFRVENLQAEVDARPARAFAEDHEGPVVIESYTVMHERDGSPATAFAACLTADGARTWATTSELDVLEAMEVEELCDRPAHVGPGRRLLVP
jgi:acetyl-CoA C-acetyltransferase